MALLILLIIGIVVGQTALDWRDSRQSWALPEWASGLCLAALVATPMTATASFASMWYQDTQGVFGSGIGAWFWLELGFAFCAMGIVVAATRKRRIRTLLVVSACMTVALWLGLAIFS